MAERRALLLTDVVDSTRLASALGDAAMAEVWAAHDRAARDLLPAWRGREIDKTDGMLMLFDGAADALGYARAYHEALARLAVPLRARAGLHVGPVLLRENSAADIALGAKPLEVEGLAKPTAARVMAIAGGGQTLLTAEAREDLGRTELALRSHGHWMVKGVDQPIELFEAAPSAAGHGPAPADGDKAWRVVRRGDWWMPVSQIPHNLPQQATRFVGREREIAEVRALLPQARMLTLLGMGGLGKTRLSLQVAAESLHQYPDGVWFIDLAPLRDPALVLPAVARVIGLTEEPDRPLLQALCAQLREQRMLFVLDNCEHLIQPCASLAFAVVQAAPQVHILASSRQGLHIPAERTYPVLPLPLPAAGAAVEALAATPAVQLFVDRARQHKPSFTLGEREARAVAELVTRLEGIPLAIELAAARVRAMTLTDINARLQDRYRLLTGGARGLQERQQTLRALVDWSYDLLKPAEQSLFSRLGIFAGGFDLAAAEAVCGDAPLDPMDVLDLLTVLVEQSLVMLDDHEGVGRYRMLETLREYAREQLAARGELLAVGQRHVAHYFEFAKEAGRGLRGPEQPAWMQRTEVELDNLRAAMALALSGADDPVLVVKFAVSLQGFWSLRGRSTEGRALVRAALALPAVQASDRAQAWALYVGAALADNQSDHAEARDMLQRCLALRRRLGQPVEIAATLSTLALSRLHAGDAQGARADETEALSLFRQAGDRYGEVISRLHLGQAALALGEDTEAAAELQQAQQLARAIGNVEVEAECELVLGQLALEAGDADVARARLQRSQAACAGAGDRRGEAQARWWLARSDLQAGDAEAARARLVASLRDFHEFRMWAEVLGCLEDHALLAGLRGDDAAAVRLAAACALGRERLALPLPPREATRRATWLAARRAALGDAAYHAAWAAGQAWDLDDAIRQAG